MESGFHSSVRAIGASYLRLDTISGNIANQSTPGYKRRVLVAQVPHDFAQALSVHSLDTTRSTRLDMRPGAVKVTGRTLDIALAQDHYMKVRTPMGLQYVRGGSLQLNATGQLITDLGHFVQGTQGDIYLTTSEVRIDTAGRVFERDREVSQLSVSKISSTKLSPSAAMGYTLREESSDLESVAANAVMQGQIEMSNVNVTQEMVAMIENVRHAEAMHKAAQGYEQMMQTAVRTLGGL